VDEFRSVNTLPITLADRQGDEPLRSRIQVAEIGTFNDPGRYGKFSITQAEVTNWKRLLDTHFHGRIPIDEDHKTDKGVSSEAQGWIVALEQQGKDVYATVEWTPAGEQKVREKRFLYISPTFRSRHLDQQGNDLGPALLRAALTNNPFLHTMPAISLCGQPSVAERVPDETEPGADSQRQMPELTPKTLEALGLPEDADEAKVLEAIQGLSANAGTPPETKTLDEQAAASGKVLLDAGQVATLQAQAAQGAAAAESLRVQTFESAYTKALEGGKVDAKDETKALHRKVYDASPEESLKLLDALPKIVSLDAKGAGGKDPDIELIDEEGDVIDESSARMLAKAEQLAKDENIDLKVAVMRLEAQGVEV